MVENNKKQIDNTEYKRLAYGILVDFDRLCREHQIRYSLAYGTLIGAIRHGGYIPWDDDIDVIMLRDEYEKLMKVIDQLEPQHTFISLKTNELYSASLAKIYHNHTTLKETKHRDLCDIGVYIDIFIFDFVPTSKLKRKILYYQALACRKIWSLSTYYPKTKLSIEKWLRDLAAKRQWGRKVNLWLNKKLKKQLKSSLACAMMFVYAWDWETFEVSDLEDLIEIQFEDRKFWCFRKYDEFLKRWYGDYMTLPPEEDRVIGHYYEVYYKEV